MPASTALLKRFWCKVGDCQYDCMDTGPGKLRKHRRDEHGYGPLGQAPGEWTPPAAVIAQHAKPEPPPKEETEAEPEEVVDPTTEEVDAETAMLVEINAIFLAYDLPSECDARVLEYLALRWGPAAYEEAVNA